ncbi:MAG: ester cyclase [Actinomycetia bacterium]|nr:ester cyclase [Actinomycetes bacterium]
MDERDTTDVLRAMVAMFVSGDPAEAAAVVSPDYLDHQGIEGTPIQGIEGFARVVRTNHHRFVRQNITIQDLFGIDDRAVARLRWQGRRHDGTDIDRETIDVIRTADGRAVEHWGAQV